MFIAKVRDFFKKGESGISDKIQSIFLGIIVSVCTFVIVGLALAWSNPSVNPPGGNVLVPINVGASTQTKSGDLIVLGTTTLSRATISSALSFQENIVPASTSGYAKLYAKSSDSKLYYLNDSGTEIELGGGLPIGAVSFYASSTAPSGWLKCDGSAVNRATYANLFSVIGTIYGAGNGSTTFNVPDMRGRNPIGFGQGSELTNRLMSATSGEELHTLTVNQLAAHSHTGPSSKLGYGAGSGNDWEGTGSVTTGTTGSGTPFNVMDPFLVMNCIIKY
ncbi:MAG: Tail Collar domain protein [Parcubacteria group bacterium GW2011_GWF1_45_5]|nr:MAG: Tail Collar domain protein [Parcubacteria group bacterium GW2011_GWF1_45_5]